jgi:hypothetical protein
MQLIYEGGGWDANGRLHSAEDGSFYRVISDEMKAFYQTAIRNPELCRLVEEGKLISFSVEEGIGGRGSLTLRHDRVPIPTYPFEWTPDMFILAARLTLELCERLVRQGMCLHDASFWNVLFVGRKPIFVDFTSIVPLSEGEFNGFIDEFRNDILSVLELIGGGHIQLVRRIIRDYGKSISADVARHTMPRSIRTKSRLGNAINEFASIYAISMARRIKARCAQTLDERWRHPTQFQQLAGLANAVERTTVLPQRPSKWESYYDGTNGLPTYDGSLESFEHVMRSNAKHQAMGELINKIAPERFLDLGCNRGLYAHFASRHGATAIGIDTDEMALNHMFRDGERLGSDALACFADVLAPASPVGPPNKRWPPLSERCRADLTSCLALAHHLLLGLPRTTPEALTALLSEVSSGWLILEFVHPDDPFLLQAYGPPPGSYNEKSIAAALDKHFAQIETRASSIPTRTLFICRKS